jgi:5'-methylthioadenosine phosphorylase
VQIQLAIIGGTGITADILTQTTSLQVVTTRFGSADITIGAIGEIPAAFLHRHGIGHKIPPHGIAHKANIAALASLGVRAIYATTAVGSLDRTIHPGEVVLLDDLIDMTRNQSERTFFADDVVHTDVTPPYSEQLRAAFIGAASGLQYDIRSHGTYVCTDGPRFETPAEIRMMARLGGDEFAILACGARADDDLCTSVDGLLERLQQTFRIGERSMSIGASIGLSSST